MKKKKILSSIIFLLFIIGTIVILQFSDGESRKNQDDNRKVSEATTEQDKLAMFCNNAAIYKMNQEMNQEDWKYRVTNAYVTKKKGNWPDIEENRYKLDEEGNIIDGKSFVIVEYALELMNRDSETYWLNYNYLEGIDSNKEETLEEEAFSCILISKEQFVKHDAFKTEYKKGDKKKIELVYVVEDSELKDTKTLFWCISHTGMSIQDTPAKLQSFVELKLEEKK